MRTRHRGPSPFRTILLMVAGSAVALSACSGGTSRGDALEDIQNTLDVSREEAECVLDETDGEIDLDLWTDDDAEPTEDQAGVIADAIGTCLDLSDEDRDGVEAAITTTTLEVGEPTDPPELEDGAHAALAQGCHDGVFSDCDELYLGTSVGSPEETYGSTCGGRVEEQRGGCERALG